LVFIDFIGIYASGQSLRQSRHTFWQSTPFERTPFESDFYRRFQADKLWTLVPAQAIAGQFIQSFKEFPPSQRTGSMNLDQVMEQLQSGAAGGGK
jgi:hypothetical protein